MTGLELAAALLLCLGSGLIGLALWAMEQLLPREDRGRVSKGWMRRQKPWGSN